MKKMMKLFALFGLAFVVTSFEATNATSTKKAHAETVYVAEDEKGNKYTSIFDSDLEWAQSIKLLSDITIDSRIDLSSYLKEFDFNGYRIRLSDKFKNIDSNYRSAFYLSSNTGMGDVRFIDTGVGGGINTIVTGVDDYIPCFHLNRANKVIMIEGGTYIGQGEIVYVEKGEAKIYGGSYEVTSVNESGTGYLLNCNDANFASGTAKIQVYGGSFKNYNPSKDANDGDSYVAEGYIISNTYTDTDRISTPVVAEASIDGIYYHTFEDALEVAHNGETILLNPNAATNGVLEGPGIQIASGRNLTIDLNGLTYEINNGMTGSTGSETNGWHLLKDSNITIKNGTLTKTVHYEKGSMLIQNYSNLTLDNVKLIGDDNVKYVLSSNYGDVVLKNNTEITAAENNTALDIMYWLSASYIDGVSLTIEDSSVKINGTVNFYAYGGEITEENKDNMKFTIPNDYTLSLAEGLQIVSSEDGTYQEVVRTAIYSAQQFAKKWKAAREVEGGLCGLLGTNDMTELLKEYDALDSEGKTYLATAKDADNCTIGESIAYFKVVHSAKVNPVQNSNQFFNVENVNVIQPVIIFTLIGLLSIVGYYFIQKRKNA